ncbi:MAG: hypothetical protein GY711_14460 [bacterium]|nr:hypothetical protein [bacterium]
MASAAFAVPLQGPIGTSYCGPAIPNSTGASATISATGSTVVPDNDVTLHAAGMPLNQFGYFLASQNQGMSSPPASAGVICLGANIGRFTAVVPNTGSSGAFSVPIDLTAIPVNPVQAVMPGESWNFQCWYRDAPTNNFTDGLTILFEDFVDPPPAAGMPSPTDGAAAIEVDASLGWADVPAATQYDVYFGTDATPDAGEYQGAVPQASFDPGVLTLDTTYWWRIDTINAAGMTTGAVWSFTTRPAPSAAGVVFSDGFESGGYAAGGWDAPPGDARVTAAAANTGAFGAELHRSVAITKAIDTTGLTDLRVSYDRRVSNYDAGESLFVEWFDGAQWVVLESSADTAWSTRAFDLDPAAANNPDFALRFRAGGSQFNELAFVDNVEISAGSSVQSLDALVDFGIVEPSAVVSRNLYLSNTSAVQERVTALTFVTDGASSGPGFDFYAVLGGTEYHGGASTVTHAIDLVLSPMSVTLLPLFFAPTEHADYLHDIELTGTFARTVDVRLAGLGGADPSWGFLHPVLDHSPTVVVDYDEDGQEVVQMLGSDSHTHEPGRAIVSWEWRDGPTLVSTQIDPVLSIPLGQTTLSLTITDDSQPPASAADDVSLDVHAPASVPGVLVSYYQDTFAGPLPLLDAIPASADFIENRPSPDVQQIGGKIGGSPFANDVMVRIQAGFELTSSATIGLVPFGGVDTRIELDGAPHAGPTALGAGAHTLEVRYAVLDLGDLPLGLDVFVDGQPAPGLAATLTHDRRGIAPVVHAMPQAGVPLGGNPIQISGFGFYPPDAVVVHWGTLEDYSLALGNLTWISGEELRLASPPAPAGTVVLVTVETSAGTSEPRTFTYTPTGPVPIAWTDVADVPLGASPTTAEWGPDGRLYVGTVEGRLFAITFDASYAATAVEEYDGVDVGPTSDNSILGLTFDPFDDPAGPVRVLVAHGELFAQGGSCFSGTAPFLGAVSALSGPDFDSPQTIVDALPISNHDHGINGMFVDGNGDLFICVGGNTNAGLPACLSGDLPESPFTAAIVKASTSRPDFNGQIVYENSSNGQVVDDQVLGDVLDVAGGVHVEVWASGLRNSYDAVLTTQGYVYCTDNGPNSAFGATSTSCSSQSAGAGDEDELNLVARGSYYGHPNRNRGRFDPIECVYKDSADPAIPGAFTQALVVLDASTNGIVEYRAAAFGSTLRGWLIVQKWNSRPRIVELAADGRSVVSVRDDLIQDFELVGLDVTSGPGGALIAANYSSGRIEVIVPNDAAAIGLTPYDITPWRAPSVGGQRFEIGGSGFGTLADTTVSIDGLTAPLTSVSAGRIVGIVPQNPAGATDLLDVTVTVASSSSTLTGAFRFLPSVPGLETGQWRDVADIPAALGEVASGVIGHEMFVVGEGSSATYVYDLWTDTWSASGAPRPFPGNHHAAEVVGDKLYLFGGLAGGAGRVQIYDPQVNLWSLGTDMPWNAGSCSSAVIDGKVYVCGGIVGGGTVGNLAVYDPVANGWTALPAMPTPVNHAASATDGARLFVFGGRQGGNAPQPGFDTVQAFDPVSGTWDATLTPMPAGRGGTGKAVEYFGELYVMGGEGTSGVFDEVFAYDPVLDSWRMDAEMPTARHGIFPVRFEDRIVVAGGGTNAGFSASVIVETFSRR